MDDVRYSELVFLQKLSKGSVGFEYFSPQFDQPKIVGLNSLAYQEMAATLLEDLFIQFDDRLLQRLVAKLRGEISDNLSKPNDIQSYHWANPREGLHSVLNGQSPHRLRVTYRGLRRIEELRELLKRDRILEHFGILLDLRYVHTDLEQALQRSSDTSVSVLYADLDGFKQINDKFGHAAGDEVLKKYLEAVQDSIGSFGTAYRGRGDEVVAIIIGQGHEPAIKIAEQVRKAVETMKCEHNGKLLPGVTASIGIATSPPESRTIEIENKAEERNRSAKKTGKNRVVSVSN